MADRHFQHFQELLSMSRPSPAAVERQLADAIAEHRKGKLKPAARLYRAVIAADPRNVAALEMFGMLLAQEKQYPEAERHLRAALSMSPDSLPAKYNLANTLRLQSRYEEAAPLLEAVAEAMPDRAEVQVNLGVTLFELERLNDAMRAFSRSRPQFRGRSFQSRTLGATLRTPPDRAFRTSGRREAGSW
jgi:predicted Zn-dependent protease